VVEEVYSEDIASRSLVGGQEPALRILNVAQTYFPYLAEGGRPVKVRILSRKLVQRGHAVTVLTANLGSSEWRSSGVTPVETPDGLRTMEEGVEAVYLPGWLRYRALTVNPRVIGFCRASLGRFDLVHIYGLYDLLGPTVSRYCRLERIPYVIEPMGMYRPIDRSIGLKLLWRHTMGRAFWRGASQIIATSELEQQELLDDGVPAAKVVVRYNGVDAGSCTSLPSRGTFRAKRNIPRDQLLVLFLGRLIPRKGADILIEAFAEACPASARLVIAGPEGEPGHLAYLERRAKECGVESRVLFTGPVYEEEKRALLADADLFVLPSRYENFANAAAEAIACGVPVIITDACGIRSLVDGQAGLVIAPAKDALTAALRQLLGDKALYGRLKEGCRRVAGQLSWDRLTEQMEGYYAKVLANRHGVR
jgi:glycosyltransferase involved in cell wall biosynthesis